MSAQPLDSTYEVDIVWSEEDGVFLAIVPELPGCITHGDTREEAVRMAEDAIAGWLAVAREFRDSIPVPRGYKPASASSLPVTIPARPSSTRIHSEEPSARET